MKSICIVVQNIYEADIRVRRKAEALVSAGYSVDVLALSVSGIGGTQRLEGVNVRTISLGKKRGSLARYAFEYIAFLIWAFGRVTVQMVRKRYAIVDVNTLPDFLVFASVVAKWMGAKVILDMHEITPEFYMSKYGIAENSWRISLLKRMEKVSFNFADHVITINEPIQDLLVSRGLPREKSTVVMNSVDETRFAKHLSACASDVPVAASTYVMMYHGTVTSIYGLDIAIEAFGMVHGDMPGAEFWILGDGPQMDSLKSLIQQRGLASKVRLPGFLSAAEMPAWLNRCDVGILPMRRDILLEFASPNKLSEYIVMDKAVIISRLRAIRRYFSENALAYFEPNRPAALANQMMRLYRDRELRKRLAARASQEYAPICWNVMKRRYLKLIEEMVGCPSRQGEESARMTETAAYNSGPGSKQTTLNGDSTLLGDTKKATLPAYVLVTPAWNEARFIEQTIISVVNQAVRPLRWVIVSDGSTDGTDDIVKNYATQHDWIQLVRLPERKDRNFAAKAVAFNTGVAKLAGLNYDVIGNLDGDVSFEEDYLAFLMSKFAQNSKLGVAGTPYREEHGRHADRFKSPEHVSGACQMFRRQCLEEIGGYPLIKSGGIDLIALLSAQAKGWQTRRFEEKVCLHHRSVGSGEHAGICRRLLNLGKKDYLLGSHPVFELFRIAYRMKKTYIAGGLLILIGYFWAMLRGVERTMPEDLIKIRRRDQMQRLGGALRRPLNHGSPTH